MTLQVFDVEFTKDGEVFQEAQLDDMLAHLDEIDDLLVVSHGWNNDMADAKALYDKLLGNVGTLLELRDEPESVPPPLQEFVQRLSNRRFAAVRVFWPSKRFTDESLIPGGGAATSEAETKNTDALDELLNGLKAEPVRLGGTETNPAHENAMEHAKALVPHLATVKAQKEFVETLRSVLDPVAKEVDDASHGFFTVAAETLFANAGRPVTAPAGGGSGGTAGIVDGGAAGLSDLLEGVQAAARRIANFATYYKMKARSGTVGSRGVAEMLRRVRARREAIRMHLVGHSFGGRLVTAAAHEFPPATPRVTMSLLQAAFSHNGFSGGFGSDNEPGFFRATIGEKRVSGPILITHTKNDKAVGIAYPLASRIAGQNAAALGDQDDPYGGMGRNGAQNTEEAESSSVMGLPGTKYAFQHGRIHNILSDVIEDHGDVHRIEVAYAILCAAGTI